MVYSPELPAFVPSKVVEGILLLVSRAKRVALGLPIYSPAPPGYVENTNSCDSERRINIANTKIGRYSKSKFGLACRINKTGVTARQPQSLAECWSEQRQPQSSISLFTSALGPYAGS